MSVRLSAGVRLSPRASRRYVAPAIADFGWRDWAAALALPAWFVLLVVCGYAPPGAVREWAGGVLAFVVLGGAFIALSNARLFVWLRP
jgi:hypothetical protein